MEYLDYPDNAKAWIYQSNKHLDAKASVARILFKGGNLFINGYLASSGDEDKIYQNCKRILQPN